MSDRLWKATERRIAKLFGGRRVSAPYRKGVDVETDWCVIEVKARKRLPEWIVDAVDNARAHAGESKLGIAVLHQVGSHNDLVAMNIHDFRNWFGEFTRKGGTT